MAPRRSTRLHPQIPTSEDGAGIAPRRSPRLRSRIQAGEDGAGVTFRRILRLHPQIHASDDGAGVTRRRRRTSPEASASLPDDDDMLREILLRLPPQPSSLPRASAVCKRWRGLIADPRFLRQFYAHHRKPPLLGVFWWSNTQGSVFNPILDRPDRIPPRRLSLGRCRRRDVYDVLNCRHGLVLVKDWAREEVVVCDPITGEQRPVAIPPEFTRALLGGAVLCAASDHGHVHGGCHSSPFKVVLVSHAHRGDNRPIACVYSSETDIWGNVISTEAPYWTGFEFLKRTILIGNALYWLSDRGQILECNLEGQSLAVITRPPVAKYIAKYIRYGNGHIIQGEDGAVGIAVLSRSRFQTWQRKLNCHGVATWLPWKTIDMYTILGLPSPVDGLIGRLLGYDEDNGIIFLYVQAGVYTVQIMSMQSKKLYETRNVHDYHPFTSFFTPGIAINGGSNGAEMMNET